jgi:hypothetical protein
MHPLTSALCVLTPNKKNVASFDSTSQNVQIGNLEPIGHCSLSVNSVRLNHGDNYKPKARLFEDRDNANCTRPRLRLRPINWDRLFQVMLEQSCDAGKKGIIFNAK